MYSADQIRNVYESRFNNIGNKLPEIGSEYQLMLINRFIGSNKEIQVLDAGCGNGAYAAYLLKSGYRNIYAIDLFNSIEIEELKYSKASIDATPFDTGSFDFIYSLSVIYYLPSVSNALNELYRICKPGGVVIITGHTRYSLFTIWRFFLRKFFNNKSNHLNGAKFNSCNSYIKIASNIGFSIEFKDGYTMSFIIYPIYKIFVKHFKRITNIQLPLFNKNPKPSNYKIVRLFKSETAYHFAIVLKKPIS